MGKKVASQGAVSAQRVPTAAAVNAVAAATTRSVRVSRLRATCANESNTFCGPANARNVMKVSARLRLAMTLDDGLVTPVAPVTGTLCGTPSVPAVYSRFV